MQHFVREVTIGTSPLEALEKTAGKRLSITKGRYSQNHSMAKARNEFIRTSDTLLSHFADFFFEYFILRGIFFQNRGKKHTFWRGNEAEFRPQKQQKKNTVCICTLTANDTVKPFLSSL